MQDYFFVRSGKQYRRVSFNELIYIESAGNYAKIVAGTGIFLVPVTMRQLERELPVDLFCRVSRACIVAIDRVLSFDRECICLGGQSICFSDRYRKEFERRVNILLPQNKKDV